MAALYINIGFTLLLVGLAFFDAISFGRAAHRDFKSIIMSTGVLGTFVGIFIGLWGFDTTQLESSVPQLLLGLKTAFYTSILGIGLAIFLAILQKRPEPKRADFAALFEKIAPHLVYLEHLKDFSDLKSLKKLENLPLLIESNQKNSALLAQIKENSAKLNADFAVFLENQKEILQSEKARENALNSGFAEISRGFLDTKTALNAAIEQLAKGASGEIVAALERVIKDFNDKISEQFGENFKELNSAVGNLLNWQENYKIQLNDFENAAKAASAAINDAGAAFNLLSERNNETLKLYENLANTIEKSREESQKLASILAQFGELGSSANTAFNEISDLVKTTKNDFSSEISKTKENLINALNEYQNLLQNTQNALNEATSKIETSAKSIESSLQNTATCVESSLQSTTNALNISTKELSEQNAEFAKNCIESTQKAAQEHIQSASDFAQNSLNLQAKTAQEYLQNSQKTAQSAQEQYQKQLLAMLENSRENLANALKADTQDTIAALKANNDAVVSALKSGLDALAQVYLDKLSILTKESLQSPKAAADALLVQFGVLQENLAKVLASSLQASQTSRTQSEEILKIMQSHISTSLNAANSLNTELCKSLGDLDSALSNITMGFRQDYEWFLRRVRELLGAR